MMSVDFSTLKIKLSFLLVVFLMVLGRAEAYEISGKLDLEIRMFNESHIEDKEREVYPSIGAELEFSQEWYDGTDVLVFKSFARYDQYDSSRSHGDISELLWTHIGKRYESRIGINKVFWGVTESQHLVDIINQSDFVENVDGEDKLGQPMINLSLTNTWGIVDVFVLPYFRERTFPSKYGRFYFADDLLFLPDDLNAVFESSKENKHVDFAVRSVHSFSASDLALSYFKGTDRTPVIGLSEDGNHFQAFYSLLEQTAVEYQINYEDWIYKLEWVYRENRGDSYHASVIGFEYTLYGLWSTTTDVGLLLEYNYDERDQFASVYQDDTFIGIRIALNDVDSTSLLAGLIVDNDIGTRLWSLEIERRLAENYKISLESKIFTHVDETDRGFYQFRNEDFVTAKFEIYF